MLQIKMETREANPAYVEEKLGREFYSHLRGGGRVAAFRRDAVARAHTLYEEAVEAGAPESEISGLGLLVVQRTLVAVEDLGALLWALAAEPRWRRFTSYKAEDLDSLYEELVHRALDVRMLWAMPTDEAIDEEADHTDAQRDAVKTLRELTAGGLEAKVDFVASFWLSHRVGAKNLMHGFSVVSAPSLIDPPGAGALSKQFTLDRPRPFAASLVSKVNNERREVETTPYLVELTPEAVALVRDTAETACDLIEQLVDAWVFAVSTQHLFVLRSDLLEQLPEAEQEAVTAFFLGENADAA